MGNESTTWRLADLPFFAGLDEEFIELFADCAHTETTSFGHYLFFEGEPAERFYIIRTGKVALQTSAGSLGFFTIETLGDNDTIGWSWIFPPYKWSLTARSLSPCDLIVFDARCLRAKCEANTDFTYELMKRTSAVSAERLRAARFALLNQLA